MAVKKFYHDIDMAGVGQLVNTRIQNVTNSEETALAATLGAANKGLIIYNTDDQRIKTWDGAAFDPFQIDVEGDVKFAGMVDASVDAEGQITFTKGFQYVVSTAGTLAFSESTVTITPNAEVSVGDMILVTDTDELYVVQRNDVLATETVAGNILLATSEEAIAGTDAGKAITPATLAAVLADRTMVSQYTADVNLTAGTPLTINHALGLTNANAFVINAVHEGAVVALDVAVVDGDNLSVESLVSLTDVTVTVHAYKI